MCDDETLSSKLEQDQLQHANTKSVMNTKTVDFKTNTKLFETEAEPYIWDWDWVSERMSRV